MRPVRYALCAVVGIALAVGALAALVTGTHAVTQAAGCAASQPAASTLSCTDGLGAEVLRLIAGVAGMIVGVAVFAARGLPGGTAAPATPDALARRGPRMGIAGAAWAMMWLGLAAAVWYAAHGPNGIEPAGDGAAITVVALTFAAIGLLSLATVLAAILVGRRGGPAPGGGEVPGADVAELVRQAREMARTAREGGGAPRPPDEFGEPR